MSSHRRFPRCAAVAAGSMFTCAIGSGNAPKAMAADACPVSDVEYSVVSSVAVRGTTFGAANGVYPLGVGKVVLRFDRDAVKLLSYDMSNHLTVKAKVAMLSTTVVTTSLTTTAANRCGGSARGTMHEGTLDWGSNVTGYHSDGTQECSGSMCGKFGAPPYGASPFHDAPATITFNAFHFSADRSTFSMEYMLVSKSASPRQTTYMALAGRRVKEACASASCPTP